MKRLMMVGIIVCLAANMALAQSVSLGIAAKGSTMGLGLDAIVQFNEKMVLRAGFDHIGAQQSFEFEEAGVTYDVLADVKTGGISTMFGYYLTPRIFATAGLTLNNFNTVASGVAITGYTYGDLVIPPEKVGTFTFDIVPELRISPYLGIGFGRLLNHNRLVGISFEMGAFYQGSPVFNIESDGMLSPTSNPDLGHEEYLERQFSQYSIYPVLKGSISFRLSGGRVN